ncbi:outer membrane protein assembly factor BamB family protein [Actinoallomurus bryophytorum]|uniref:outer membrane protein assembly factor BamB family protein n=1 Tax=Actinoallomurus bryophytorum TaxID=1490222 RepID=UPI0011546728|nr:PQQ-binding-like beta-propeller repeat protein [Actinoallomurus bryophytorum]
MGVRRFAGGALVATLALSACSGGPPEPAPSPPDRAGCLRDGTAPAPVPGGKGAGAIRWSVVLDRCGPAGSELPFGHDEAPWGYDYGWSATVAGGRLMLLRDGVVSAYSLRTGRSLWRRTLLPAPTKEAQWAEMSASADVVTVERGGEDSRYVFLDARTGSSLWSTDTGGEEAEFLLGGRYVIKADDEAIEGLALRTGRRLWRTAVPAPETAVSDGKVVYLSSVLSKSDRPPVQRRIVRVDAASGRRLADLPLPGPLRVDMDTAHGMLVLAVLGASTEPVTPIVKTIALQASTGRLLWARKHDVATGPGLFGQIDESAEAYTAVDPRTGRSLWTIPLGGHRPVMARPDYLVTLETERSAPGTGWIRGLAPRGRFLWTSPPLALPDYLTGTPETLLVITCDPWKPRERTGLCADHRLTAVSLTE